MRDRSEQLTSQLEQVPSIAVEILEHRDGAVRLVARSFAKLNPTSGHLAVVAQEIVGVKEKEDAAASLIPYSRHLLRR